MQKLLIAVSRKYARECPAKEDDSALGIFIFSIDAVFSIHWQVHNWFKNAWQILQNQELSE
jgi:hypothetical protein